MLPWGLPKRSIGEVPHGLLQGNGCWKPVSQTDPAARGRPTQARGLGEPIGARLRPVQINPARVSPGQKKHKAAQHAPEKRCDAQPLQGQCGALVVLRSIQVFGFRRYPGRGMDLGTGRTITHPGLQPVTRTKHKTWYSDPA